MGKIDIMSEEMGNIKKDVEARKKNQSEILELKTIVSEIKMSLDELNRKFSTTEEKLNSKLMG